MANTSVIYARVDTNLKEKAEEILAKLGITPSSAIQMFYRQILIKKGIPFDLTLPDDDVIISNNNNIIDQLLKEVDTFQKDKTYTIDEIKELISKYNI